MPNLGTANHLARVSQRNQQLLPEFQDRCAELYPAMRTHAAAPILRRICFTEDELNTIIADPNGPRLMWHFFCRARAGLEP